MPAPSSPCYCAIAIRNPEGRQGIADCPERQGGGRIVMVNAWLGRVTAAGLAVAAALAAGPADAADKPMLHITLIEATPAFHSLPVFALKQNAKDYNLEVENLQIQGGGEAGVIFAGGQADIMMSGFDKPVEFMARGMVDVRVFGAILKSINWSLVVPTKSPIKTVADLKDKTIGISGAGASSDMLMRWALRRANLNPDKDVTLVALGSVANLYSGVENGRVEAGVLVRPFLSKAVDSGMARVVGDWEALPYPNLVSIARAKDLETHPETFQRFQSALRDILKRFASDRPFALKMAKLAYPQDTDDNLGKQLDFAEKVYWNPMNGDMSRELYDHAADMLVTSGAVAKDKMPAYEKFVVTLPDG
jgi:NitT/TauT family transport system substrate-binding protein